MVQEIVELLEGAVPLLAENFAGALRDLGQDEVLLDLSEGPLLIVFHRSQVRV